MRLGVKGSYLIHGTGQTKADGIGMMVTHGCMRMYPEDVAQLFPIVSLGTQVNLVNQPVKLGWYGDTLYIEVSQPLDDNNLNYQQLLSQATALIQKKTADRPGFGLNGEALKQALEKPDGIPTAISGRVSTTIQAANPGQQPQQNIPPVIQGGGQPGAEAQAKPEAVPGPAPTSQVAIPNTQPAAPVAVPSSGPVTMTNQSAPPQPRPIATNPAQVRPAPSIIPANSKSEEQLLPPIY